MTLLLLLRCICIQSHKVCGGPGWASAHPFTGVWLRVVSPPMFFLPGSVFRTPSFTSPPRFTLLAQPWENEQYTVQYCNHTYSALDSRVRSLNKAANLAASIRKVLRLYSCSRRRKAGLYSKHDTQVLLAKPRQATVSCTRPVFCFSGAPLFVPCAAVSALAGR